jgi:rubrerythrin
MYSIFRKKHQLWLKITFGSFMVRDKGVKDELYEIGRIYFRHLKWIAKILKDKEIEYDYFKDDIDINFKTTHELYISIINDLESIKPIADSSLQARIDGDNRYFQSYLKNRLKDTNKTITAFNRELKFNDRKLDASSTQALVRFLFEESYKEYELVMVYSYMQIHTDNLQWYDIFDDLIYESYFHLKSFGNLMSDLGILSIPRTIIESIYKTDNIVKFLIDGVKEEEAAKVLCQELASSIKDEKLSQFFTFIDFQESYHIELLKTAISKL